MRKFLSCTIVFSHCILLAGCATVLATGATTSAVVVAQERSVGNAVDDVGIRLTINKLFLETDAENLLADVNIKVVEGRVLLTGDVENPETAIEAVRLSWRAAGVREVINEIQIQNTASISDYARDVWISTQIRSRLLFTKNVFYINYNIETINGIVYVIGIAQNEVELGKVMDVIRTTQYVRQVVSHVILKSDTRRKP